VTVELVGTLEEARDDWELLDAEGDSVFRSWTWASCWWRAFGGQQPLRITKVTFEDGRVALVPLYLWRARPLRVLRLIGHGPADELGAVGDPGLRGAALDAAAGGAGAWDALLAEHVAAAERPHGPGYRRLRSVAAPTLRFDGGSWDELLASKSSNFRQQVRRRERNLVRDHAVGFRLATSGPELDAALDTLFDLHRRRWGDRSAFAGRHESFHRAFADAASRQGWTRVWLLELDGRPAAAWYGFRRGGVESYYQAGWDPSIAESSAGTVLLAHSIRSALQDGMREYRFLQGDEKYKYRFASEVVELETFIRGQGWRGAVGTTIARAGTRVPALRRRAAAALGFE
jgi:CelD/BcsL family acetyltransferase involved in cellulose biosynthesis